MGSIPFGQFQFCFLQWVGTLSTFLEYLLRVVYIPSRIVIKEIFLNLNGQLICGFNSKFSIPIKKINSGIELTPYLIKAMQLNLHLS